MIYYPLSTLILAGVEEITVVSSPNSISDFHKLLGSGEHFGISIDYEVQDEPKGIPDALNLVSKKYPKENICMILGDNIFYGMGLGIALGKIVKDSIEGAICFGYKVKNPEEYGVVKLDNLGKPMEIKEKPKEKDFGNVAIPGLYFFDSTLNNKLKKLKPSLRGELEITELLNQYLTHGELQVNFLERGTVWLDAGTIENLAQANELIEVLESRQGQKIGCPEEASFRVGHLNLNKFMEIINVLPNGEYRIYLEEIAQHYSIS